MSEATQNTETPSQCDRLLDYVYGELSGDDLEQFKLHLLSCEKCKRELAGLERVRSAVKQAMPAVEPPVDKMAQLMLAAAQQKPKRGKVLMFARRIVSHPAYAAAAVFVLVATSVTINWSRHALQMPPPEAVHEPVAAPTVAAPAPAAGEKELQAAPPAELALPEPEKVAAGPRDKSANKEPTYQLKTDPGSFTVHRAPPAKKGSEDFVLQPTLDGYKSSGGGGRVATGAMTDDAKAPAARHAATRALGKDEEAPAGRVTTAIPKPAAPRPAAAPAAPPPPPPKAKVAEKAEGYSGKGGAVSRPEGGLTNSGDTAESPVAQAPARESAPAAQNQWAPPPAQPATSTPQAPALTEAKAQVRTDNTARQQKTVDPMAQKKQFLAYAQSNRCPEAVSLFQQLDARNSGLFTPTDRAEYARCLRRTGQNNLADLEDKAIQQEVNGARASKKGKKARPASAAEAAPPATLEPASK